ncbi:MAG: MFS transporter [Bacteroidales bacterium]|nr:MFS transporter [Bacteroidales bacterium]
MSVPITKDLQYYKFCLYGFLKNLRFFEPFLYLFLLEKGLTYFQIGTLITVRELMRNLMEIPSGVLADVFGRRRTLILSFLSYILSFIAFYLFSSYFAFLLAMIIYAFGDSFRTGTHKAMIFEYLDINGWNDQKVYYYGHTRSWSQIGSALSSLAAAFLVFYSGNYQIIFLYSIVPYVLDLMLIVSYPRALEGSGINWKVVSIGTTFRTLFEEFKQSFLNLKFAKNISNIASFSGYLRAVKDYLQPMVFMLVLSLPVSFAVSKERLSSLVIGGAYFVIYLLTSIASRNAGSIAGKFGDLSRALNKTLVFGLLLGAISGLLYSTGSVLWSVISVLLFISLFVIENIRRPVGVSYLADLFDKKILATTLSVESQVKGIFAAILAPLMGFLADLIGIGQAMVIISIVMLVIFPLIRIKHFYIQKGNTNLK